MYTSRKEAKEACARLTNEMFENARAAEAATTAEERARYARLGRALAAEYRAAYQYDLALMAQEARWDW